MASTLIVKQCNARRERHNETMQCKKRERIRERESEREIVREIVRQCNTRERETHSKEGRRVVRNTEIAK